MVKHTLDDQIEFLLDEVKRQRQQTRWVEKDYARAEVRITASRHLRALKAFKTIIKAEQSANHNQSCDLFDIPALAAIAHAMGLEPLP